MGVTEPFQPLATLLAAAKAHFTPQYVETTKQWERLPLGHELCDYRDAIKKATAGEEKEHAIVKMLDELGYERNVLQVQMHQHFINALAPQVCALALFFATRRRGADTSMCRMRPADLRHRVRSEPASNSCPQEAGPLLVGRRHAHAATHGKNLWDRHGV